MLTRLLLISLLLFSATSYAASWECINRVMASCNTWRMEVPTGWVVASDNTNGGEHGYAMTFVPDPEHKWKL